MNFILRDIRYESWLMKIIETFVKCYKKDLYYCIQYHAGWWFTACIWQQGFQCLFSRSHVSTAFRSFCGFIMLEGLLKRKLPNFDTVSAGHWDLDDLTSSLVNKTFPKLLRLDSALFVFLLYHHIILSKFSLYSFQLFFSSWRGRNVRI